MSSYIGLVSIENQQYKIGSTLFGTCNTPANTANKRIALSDFDQLMSGITVHIKFTLGNTVSTGATLQFYPDSEENSTANFNVAPISVEGNFICATNSVIAFTLEENQGVNKWYVNNSVNITESATNGNITVNGQNIPVHGLGSAAYTSSDTYAPKNNPTFTGTVTIPAISNGTTGSIAATVDYVNLKTAGLNGLTGAMHFIGEVNTIPPSSGTYESGDVVLLAGTHKEYVYVNDGNTSQWIELGDEGSFILQSAVTEGTASYIGANGFTTNTLPTLTVDHTEVSQVTKTDLSVNTTQYAIPKVTQAGTPMTAGVANGVLTLTPGTNTRLDNNNIIIHGFSEGKNLTIPNISINTVFLDNEVHFTQGTQASLNKNDITVLIPNSSNNNP